GKEKAAVGPLKGGRKAREARRERGESLDVGEPARVESEREGARPQKRVRQPDANRRDRSDGDHGKPCRGPSQRAKDLPRILRDPGSQLVGQDRESRRPHESEGGDLARDRKTGREARGPVARP